MNIRSLYTITIIFLFLSIISTATVSAYYLSLDAPAEVRVGEPVIVTGTTNVPPPDKIDIVFSHSINIPVEITRESKEITKKGDTIFNVTFNTTGLERGNYKVEAISQTQRDFSGGSKNLRVVKLIDRSDIIRFTSSKYQEATDKLDIEARIQDYDDNAIQMEIKKGNKTLFGPESIPVSRGHVKYELPIKEQGIFSITFTDSKGYIGTYQIQVGEETGTAPEQPSETPTPLETDNVNTSTTENPQEQQNGSDIQKPSEESTPLPTRTQVPVPTAPEPVKTMNGSTDLDSVVRTSAQVSRDSPGYFLVSVKQTPVTVTTSDNGDWVLEFKTDPAGAGVKVNDQMKEAAEKFTVSDTTNTIYLKVYPYSYKAGNEVTIIADNADAVKLSDEAAKAFGAPPRYGSKSTETPGKSPAPLVGLIGGLIGAAYLVRRRQ